MFTLHQSGMDLIVWRLLREAYSNFECRVRIDGKLSNSFIAGQGVHQGAPWSMYLYQRSYNNLLVMLKASNANAKVYHLLTGNPAYADDLSVVSLHKPVLQNQLDTIYQYSRKWRFTFNPSKSVVIIYGTDQCPSKPIKLGNQQITVKSSDEHLGIFLGDSRDDERMYVEKRVLKAKQAYFMSVSLGSRSVPVSPLTMSKLYWTICIPRMLYGMEIVPLSSNSIEMMEQAHNSMAKMTQGLPNQTANVSCLAPLGWRTIETHLDYLKVMFLWRILSLSVRNIYKQLCIMRLWYHLYHPEGSHYGPLQNIVDTFVKYDLRDILDRALKSGDYMQIKSFKQLVSNVMGQYEHERFKISCLLYKSLTLFRDAVPKIGMWTWWKYMHAYPLESYKVRILARLLHGQNALNEVIARFNKGDPKCTLCESQSVENVKHLLFECSGLDDVRLPLWNNVMDSAPQGMRDSLENEDAYSRAIFIISAMSSDFVPEWSELYSAFLNYCYTLYMARQQRCSV